MTDLAARVAGGRRAERFRGTADLPNFLRHPAGPGWALVGDAGCHKDPLPAQGISDALRDAELLADALHAGLTATSSMGEAMAGYATAREVRLTELLAALSLAVDLGLGRPMEHVLRQTLIAFAARRGRGDGSGRARPPG